MVHSREITHILWVFGNWGETEVDEGGEEPKRRWRNDFDCVPASPGTPAQQVSQHSLSPGAVSNMYLGVGIHYLV